jgi:hypothetical protein
VQNAITPTPGKKRRITADPQPQQPSSEDELTESIVLDVPSGKSLRSTVHSTPAILAGDDDLGPDDADNHETPTVRFVEADENGASMLSSAKTRRDSRTDRASLQPGTTRMPLGTLDPVSARNSTFNDQTLVSSDRRKSISARTRDSLPVILEDEPSISQEIPAAPSEAQLIETDDTTFQSTVLEEDTSIVDESSIQASVLDTRIRRSETFAPDLEGTRTEPTQTSNSVSNVAKAKPKPRKKRDTVRSNEHVEIKVYRRKGQSADIDPLGSAPTQPINSADVLAQFVSDLGETYISKIKARQSGSAPSKQLPRILMALTSFMTYCEDTLFEITVAQNAVHVLTARLNKIFKDQGGLRAELMNVKLEREAVRRKIDSVRARHSGQAEAEQAQNDLLTTLHDLDIAIQRGRASGQTVQSDDPEDPSTVYDELMETIHGNHIVDSLKDWNSLLETSCQVLK